jgi:hypothetical protein
VWKQKELSIIFSLPSLPFAIASASVVIAIAQTSKPDLELSFGAILLFLSEDSIVSFLDRFQSMDSNSAAAERRREREGRESIEHRERGEKEEERRLPLRPLLVFLLELFVSLCHVGRRPWPSLRHRTQREHMWDTHTEREERGKTSPFLSFSMVSQVGALTAVLSSKEIVPPV